VQKTEVAITLMKTVLDNVRILSSLRTSVVNSSHHSLPLFAAHMSTFSEPRRILLTAFTHSDRTGYGHG
jgi:hypothetical protein